MTAWVIDYANDRPNLADAKNAGCVAIARYLSMFTTTGKNLDANEVAQAKALGLGVVVVYEDDGGALGGGPAQGFQRGANDRNRAEGQADALGIPSDRPIYMAVDTDTIPRGTVAGYFQGVKTANRRPVGGYGQPQLMEYLADAGLIGWLWTTAAWSGGYRSPRAHLFQRIGKTYARNVGGDFDENDPLKADFGQWYPGQTQQQNNGGLTVIDNDTKAYLDAEFQRISDAVSAAANAGINADNNIRNDILAKAQDTKNQMLAWITAVDNGNTAKQIEAIDAFAAELKAGLPAQAPA